MPHRISRMFWNFSLLILFMFLLYQYLNKVPALTIQPSCITWQSSANFNMWDYDDVPLPKTQTEHFSEMLGLLLFVEYRLLPGTRLTDDDKLQVSFVDWVFKGFYADQYIIAAKRLVHQHQWEPYLSKEWVGDKMVYSENACRDVAAIMTTEPPAN